MVTNKLLVEGLHGRFVLRALMFLLAVLVLLLPVSGCSQLDRQPNSLDQVDRKTLMKVDVDSLLAEDQKRGKAPQDPGPLRFAVTEDVDFNLNNSGTWQTLSDGRLWRLRIHSPGALSPSSGANQPASSISLVVTGRPR